MSTIRLPSYAKINLSLRVKGKRNDGFHEIESLIQQIDLKDDIELTTRSDERTEFSCNVSDLAHTDDNLCLKAARLFRAATETREGVCIKLNKIIPIGAGLGGGSSNAAVTLLGLNALCNSPLTARALCDLAARLGSDVPFFVHGGLATARGRGEKLERHDFQFEYPIVVVNPGIHVSTAWAYSRLNLGLTKSKKRITLASFNDRNFNNVEFYRQFKNDFEGPIFDSFPVLREIKEEILELNPLYASMSGSGSSLFAMFRDAHDAEAAKQQFEAKYQAFVCRSIRWGFNQLHDNILC